MTHTSLEAFDLLGKQAVHFTTEESVQLTLHEHNTHKGTSVAREKKNIQSFRNIKRQNKEKETRVISIF